MTVFFANVWCLDTLEVFLIRYFEKCSFNDFPMLVKDEGVILYCNTSRVDFYIATDTSPSLHDIVNSVLSVLVNVLLQWHLLP